MKSNKSPIMQSEKQPEVLKIIQKGRFNLGFWINGFKNTGIRTKPVSFKGLGVMSDIPKHLFKEQLVMIVRQFKRNYINKAEFHTQFPNKRMVHMIQDIGCYEYLPESIQKGKYSFKRYYDLDEELKLLTPPTYTQNNHRVKISFPDSIFIDDPKKIEFYFWEKENKVWSQEKMEPTQVVRIDGKQFFDVSIPRMAPVIALADYWSEFPYDMFKLRRVGYRTIQFDLQTKNMIKLCFRISPGYVELINIDKPQLNRLKDKVFTPQKLLLELKRSNINIVPNVKLSQ